MGWIPGYTTIDEVRTRPLRPLHAMQVIILADEPYNAPLRYCNLFLCLPLVVSSIHTCHLGATLLRAPLVPHKGHLTPADSSSDTICRLTRNQIDDVQLPTLPFDISTISPA